MSISPGIQKNIRISKRDRKTVKSLKASPPFDLESPVHLTLRSIPIRHLARPSPGSRRLPAPHGPGAAGAGGALCAAAAADAAAGFT